MSAAVDLLTVPGDGLAEQLGLGGLRAVSLAEITAVADLQHRVDRKYLLRAATAAHLVADLSASHQVLEIDGRRTTGYRSTYFDTPELAAWRAHVQGRRRRWKVRTRLYTEDGLCRMEVKAKDGRGATLKHALGINAEDYGRLDGAVGFVDDVLKRTGAPVNSSDLTPTAEVCYTRAALADLETGTRVTLDGLLTCHHCERTAAMEAGYILVETKGNARLADADRVLLSLGARPVSVSKYIIGLSLLVPGLPENDFRRLSRTHFRTLTCMPERNHTP